MKLSRMRLRRLAAGALAALMALCASVAILTALLSRCGSSADMMLVLMRREAPEASTGLPDSEYLGMVAMITGYLSGNTDTFQYTWTDGNGTEYAAFNEREQAHMADCRSLFVLDRRVLLTSVMAGIAAFVGAVMLHPDRRTAATGAATGFGLALLAAGALVAMGMVNFDELFIGFHQLMFTNDLWLMNPRTDMIIRLMPETFFIDYAAMIGITWLTAVTLALVISILAMRRGGERA